MASTYDNRYLIEYQVTGENDDTWGDITNDNLEALERAIGNFETLQIDSAHAGSTTWTGTPTFLLDWLLPQATAADAGNTDAMARSSAVSFTSGSLGGGITINVCGENNTTSCDRTYWVSNDTTGGQTITFKNGGGSDGLVLANGATALLVLEATASTANAFISDLQVTDLTASGTVTGVSIVAAGTVTGVTDLTASGTVTAGTITTTNITTDGTGTIGLDGNHPDGTDNVALGKDALDAITSGTDNTAIGFEAGKAITGGLRNVALGSSSLSTITTGNDNVSIGYNTLNALLTTSAQNVVIGSGAGAADTGGDNNVYIGHSACSTGTIGVDNVAIGQEAFKDSNGVANVVLGRRAADGASFAGDENVILGANSVGAATSASDNVILGANSCSAMTTADSNVIIGYNAVLTGVMTGNGNVVVGVSAAVAATSAADNVVIGNSSCSALTAGTDNIAIGKDALNSVTTTSHNIGIGTNALSSCTGISNIAIGRSAGIAVTTGIENVVLGYNSGLAILGGDRNVTLGKDSGLDVTSGNDNIMIGHGAGADVTTGSSNIIFGINGSNNSATLSGNIRLGRCSAATADVDDQILISATTGLSNDPLVVGNLDMTNKQIKFDVDIGGATDYGVQIDHTAPAITDGYTLLDVAATAVGTSGWDLCVMSTDGGTNRFRVDAAGTAYATGHTVGGADYADMFEWDDGNAENQDRAGYPVVLRNGKISIAFDHMCPENIIGVVSMNPSVLGNAAPMYWDGKYIKDDFGRELGENPEYDHDRDYQSRWNRPEWDAVCLTGRIALRKGELAHPNWQFIREISESAEEWLVR